MKKSIIVIAGILLLAGCVPKPLEITLEEIPPKPVIWSQVLGDNVSLIYFGRSFSALAFDENDTTDVSQELLDQVLVNDGQVTIEHAGETDTLIYLSNGIYASFFTELQEGEVYTLEAEDYVNGEVVSSSTTMLPFVELIDISAVTVEELDSSKTIEITYSFEDLPGETYYQMNYYSAINDPLALEDPLEADGLSETQLITDQAFEGSLIETTYTLDFLEFDTVFVSFSAISEQYYNYLALRQRSGNIFTQIVQEPINYPSNVTGGYGFFNLYIPDIDFVVVPD